MKSTGKFFDWAVDSSARDLFGTLPILLLYIIISSFRVCGVIVQDSLSNMVVKLKIIRINICVLHFEGLCPDHVVTGGLGCIEEKVVSLSSVDNDVIN
ncbi:MAG: hypothetical protein MJE68_27810, partial [Proteobacteria bacterium]|nr:hypothetical protein [Pseudomonadota bacterium]